MKKTFVIFLGLLILCGGLNSLSAQQKENVVKFAPLSVIVLTGNVQYERMLSPRTSINLGFYHGGLGINLSTENTSQRYNFIWSGITPEFRYYLTGMGAPEGLYFGPYLRLRRVAVKWRQQEDDQFGDPYISDVKVRFLSMGGGVVVGYQALVGELITLDTYLGIGYNSGKHKVIYNTGGTPLEILEVVDFRGFALRPGFTVGFAF